MDLFPTGRIFALVASNQHIKKYANPYCDILQKGFQFISVLDFISFFCNEKIAIIPTKHNTGNT